MRLFAIRFAVILFCQKVVLSELYTALVDLKEVLYTEGVLIKTLETYIHAETTKLKLLQRYVDLYKSQHQLASEDVDTYVANPINAYLLIKRLTADWRQVESLLHMNLVQETVANISAYKEYLKFPTDEDLNGAAVALTRLQDTYKLDTSSLARGELNGVKYSSELSATDCFELGRQSYNNGDFYHTQLWMTEADSRLGREKNETIDKSEILEYLAFSTFKLGDVPLALDLTNKLLEIYPNHPRAVNNKNYYESALAKTQGAHKKGDDNAYDVPIVSDMPVYSDSLDPPERTLYEQLCRGEVKTPVEITSKLKCYYYNKNRDPFLLLAPFKVEEAYKDPDIFIFHDVMYDEEIETIKNMARPRFKRATVQNYKTGELETAQYRISKSAWLKEIEHKHVANVCKRVVDMTGLTVETAEELQVVNYGIGGHYEPHFDFARRDEVNAFKSLGTGNRIATVLFYMSDVAQGGATVFPHLKLALWPKKGTAAFWYNLHSSGDGHILTRHAACPVLAGSKWVSNKWIHEMGQEFRRPCDLQPPPPELTI
ncbi:prolyl 4-hydroxylase subunit alpha-1 [Agrilus planipennis]|uniref:procollagen-proline 4-dioxygenase n=1 Tax=Agrilus planipennis TaxID=224129 RepID=A0A1W4XI42_AGRPL|nr:prolyl 4-hydroxylase subunit alpha-1 [Agrilus planipennis]XP_025831160.1 prolyl 4-hydroxylase subunit alpha-1 [Agrilus planipennis]